MEDRPFNIVDYIPGVRVEFTSGAWTDPDNVYDDITLTGPDGVVFQSQIDVAGWTKDGLTAFFANQYVQRDGPYTAVGIAAPADTLFGRDYVIITDVPLELGPNVIHAGFQDDASDYMTIKFGQATMYTQVTTSTSMIQTEGWNFGSGEPTASGTLYVTRICIADRATPVALDSVTFPALRFVAQGIATAEPEFVYLNRLRRSYEQQTRS